jgi:multiple sugar transport system substrate-binding protein
MGSLLKGFHREHPEVPIEVTELSWSDGKTKLMLGFNSGTAPDVLELGSDWVPQFASSGVLEDLTAVHDSEFSSRFRSTPQYALEPSSWTGEQYAVPWMLDTRVMFVNDSLAQLAGYSTNAAVLGDWQSMSEFAKRVHATGAIGCGVNGSDEHRLYKKVLPYFWSNGGELFDSSGKPTFTLSQNVEALQYYVDQQNFGKVESQKNLDDEFRRGSIGAWFSGSWMMNTLKSVPFKWHTEPFPGNRGMPGISFAGGEYLAINAKSVNLQEAQTFVKFITRPDNELQFAEAVNMFPADTARQHDSFYLNRREGPVFATQLKHSRMTPVVPQWLAVEAILDDEVSRALYHMKTPAEAMASAQHRVEELLREP